MEMRLHGSARLPAIEARPLLGADDFEPPTRRPRVPFSG